MADKIRIYQLAKELGVESKTMLTILDDMGVDYKAHSSSLDSETAETVRQLVAESGGKPRRRGGCRGRIRCRRGDCCNAGTDTADRGAGRYHR